MTADQLESVETSETARKDNNAINKHKNIAPDILNIFDFLSCNNKIIFKSQQIDDPELQRLDKVYIAQELFERNRQTFLMRFGSYLEEEHLLAFAQSAICEEVSPPLRDDENYDEMQFMLHDYQSKLHTKKQDIKNRRYAAMQQMLKTGDYFCEQEMMKRAPELYQELVGQYLSETEIKQRDGYDVRNTTFSGILMHTMEQQEMQNILKNATEKTAISDYESDSSQDSNNSSKNNVIESITENEDESQFIKQWGNFDNEEEEDDNKPSSSKKNVIKNQNKIKTIKIQKTQKSTFITAGERNLLRQEFIGIMQQKFLAGKDENFDYSAIDEDSKLDDLQQLNQDKEDAYFDDDEENTAEESITRNMERQESDDELDIFMNHLQQHHSLKQN